MSYARFSSADVYVYLDCCGFLRCCACRLAPPAGPWSIDFTTTADLMTHLEEHRAKGHDVPERTLERLKEDAAENDAWIAAGPYPEGAP